MSTTMFPNTLMVSLSNHERSSFDKLRMSAFDKLRMSAFDNLRMNVDDDASRSLST